MKSAIGMTDEQCQTDKMPGLRGGRELTMVQVAKLVSSGRRWPGDLVTKAGARTDFYAGGEPNEIATPRQVGARNDKRTPNEIAGPSTHGVECWASNDKRAWCWMKEAATKSWRRDLNLRVSSLVLGVGSKTTISAHEAFSTGRVPVGRGQRTTPQISLGWSKDKQ